MTSIDNSATAAAVGRRFQAPLKSKLRLLRRHACSIVVWPLAGTCLCVALWFGVLTRIAEERDNVTKDALGSAAAHAASYAGQLERTLGQIDYLLLSLKYFWQETGGETKLEEQLQKGLVSSSAEFVVTVVNRDGYPVSSTMDIPRNLPGVADRDYFIHHRSNPSSGLIISEPFKGIRLKEPVILLSRRLETAGGGFDGIVVLAVRPKYLTGKTDQAILNRSDFIAVRRDDGAILTTDVPAGGSVSPEVFLKVSKFNAEQGLLRMAGEPSIDQQGHVVAWQKLKNFPIYSVVGLSEKRIYARFEERANELRLFAVAGSVVLFLLSALGAVFSVRLASRKHQAAQIKAAYRLATDEALEGFYMLLPHYDDKGEIVDFIIEDCNERGGQHVGSNRADLLGQRISRFYGDGFQDEVLPVYLEAMKKGFHESEIRITPQSAIQINWVYRRILRSGNGLAVILRDISESRAHQEALLRLANTDAVTALPNRHWLMNYLPAALEAARIRNGQVAILFVDLDDFKNINDTLGHAAGDQLLASAALRLKDVLRPQDSVVRLGGDEFTVILETVESESDVAVVAERVIRTLGEPFTLEDGAKHIVHASVGVSMFPRDGDDGQTLLKHADIAMYAVKGNGKRNYQFFQPEFSANLVARISKQRELQRAIERNEFELHYQPRVLANSGRLNSMEALVRWIHPERGMIAPNDFIPEAEESGLIVPLGELVIARACAQLAEWKERNLPVVPVSINVSPQQINKGSVSAALVSNMRQYGIEPWLVEIEITESGIVGKDNATASELAAIEELGIRLYVDDFGTGYSSLSQLRRLDMDGLKIDKSFTATLGKSPDDEAFFRAIVAMAHAIDMRVVAEGVETEEQLQILRMLQCDEVQGYLISKPVPAAEVPGLMRKDKLL